LRQQFPDSRFLVNVRQNQKALRRNQTFEPRDRLLAQGLLSHQTQQLLRPRSPAQGPEALTASTGED